MPKKPYLLILALLVTLGVMALMLYIGESLRATPPAENELSTAFSNDPGPNDDNLLAASSQTELDFTEVSRQVGKKRKYEGKKTYGPLWGDLNGDGWVDLIFMNHGSNLSLYLNQHGKRFIDGFDRSGLQSGGWLYEQQGDRPAGACADYDNDGDVDLFIAHGAKRGDTLGVKYDELLKNAGDPTFEEVTRDAGTLNSQGRARAPIWTDYDNDGLLDLYIEFSISQCLKQESGRRRIHGCELKNGPRPGTSKLTCVV